MDNLLGIAQQYYGLLYVTLIGSCIAMVAYFLVLYAIPESSGNWGSLRRFLTKVGNVILLITLVQVALSLVARAS